MEPSEYYKPKVGDIVYVSSYTGPVRRCRIVAVFPPLYTNFPQWNKVVIKPLSGIFRGERIEELGNLAYVGEVG